MAKAATMLEAAYIIAGIAVVSLVLAIAAAVSPLGRRQLRRLDGTVTAKDRYLQMATYLLMAAVGLSMIAAGMAVAELLAP
jgi:hypothetical protein